MAFKKRELNPPEIFDLLTRIEEGHNVTDIEKKALSSVKGIDWFRSGHSELPNSIGMLISLSSLSLNGMKVKDISALNNLTSLTYLDLSMTQVKDISVLSNLTSLISLDLSGTPVKDISVLNDLTSLTNLRLGDTQVKDISALSNLTSLTNLILSNTPVKDISVLSNLTSLAYLDLSMTQVKDISALSNLTSLISLDLSGTPVKDISALSNLTSLRFLYLNGTQVDNVSALSNLTFLINLNLGDTQVNDISALLGLKNLELLDLSQNEIKDLNALSRLSALKQLNIQNLKSESIPESLLDLNLDFFVEQKKHLSLPDEGIYIYGLTLTDQPIEIFSQGRELIREYFREEDKVPVNECKVIFLGDAESGKTHSIKRLLNDGEYLETFNGESTPGIEITISTVKLAETDIVINYWDFGGQEIQHSMHRVFLTERTVYVVFLNARQDDLMDERARYWMENIKAFAPDAPVLVVINKIDQNEHPRFNEKGFIDSYGNQVKNVIRLSAKTDEKQVFLDKLESNINSIIMNLPTVRKKIPRSWKNLMGNVREMTDHYLTTEQFINKCQANSIKNYEEIHDELVDLFQVVGVSFCYYKNRSVADYMLLNPKWMLNALYTIVTNGKTVAQNGVITQDNLYDLLQKDSVNGITIRRVVPNLRYKGTEVNYILGVIRMFSLSYSLKDGSEFFPMLCDGDEKISVKNVVPEDALHFIFRYTYLPTNVMHRLIVEMQMDLDYQYVWYTGAVFRNTQQSQTAYIHSAGNDLHIYVFGDDPYYNLNEYLTPISNIVREINKTIRLSAVEYLTLRKNGVEAEISLEEVRGNLRNGINKVYNAKLNTVVPLHDFTKRYPINLFITDDILKAVVNAIRVMQRDMTFYRSDENSRNRFVSALVTAQLKGTGKVGSDQQTGGVSTTGKAPGERDFVVKDENGQEILIYEGLNLKSLDKTYLDKHINKALVDYNPEGLSYNILVTYLECSQDKFKSFVDKYREHIEGYAPTSYRCIGRPEVIRFEGEFLHCLKMQYETGGLYFTIYHIIVRMGQ